MEYGKFRYLSLADLEKCGLRDWDQAMEVAEATYMEHSKGMYEMPPKPGVHPTTCPGAFHHAMPAYLPNSHAVGIKWVAVYGHNPQKYNCNSTSALMVLNDEETGYPVAIMEAGLITAIRTANASAVSAKYLARKDAKTVGMVGCGEMGRFTVRALLHVMPELQEINKLSSEYTKLISSAKIEFRGEVYNLPQMGKFTTSNDRKTRKEK